MTPRPKIHPDPEHGDEVENRINAIMDLMRDLRWRRGSSGPMLAKQWGLGEHRLKELAAEASRRLRAEYEDPERNAVSVYTTLEAVMFDGAASSVPGEKAAAVNAARLMSELLGMGAEKKQPTAPTRLIVEMREPVSAFDDEVGAIEPKLDRGE
jgi:hypothetical protein